MRFRRRKEQAQRTLEESQKRLEDAKQDHVQQKQARAQGSEPVIRRLDREGDGNNLARKFLHALAGNGD